MTDNESISRRSPGDTPLSVVTDDLDSSAEAQFQLVPGGDVLCLTCRTTIPADAVDVSTMTRLEGASDPADMVMVVPIGCGTCGAVGSLVVAYGPNAGESETDFLVRSQRRPGDSPTPGVVGPTG